MTRIGQVVHGQPPELVGGTEHVVAELAAALTASGESVEVFSGSIEWRPDFEVVRLTEGPVPVVRVHRSDLFFERWDKLHNPFVERAFLDWLDAFRPDLVHIHHWARLTTNLVRLASSRGIPTVVTLHDLFASCPRYHRVRADDVFCEQPPGVEACSNCAPRWRFQGDAEIGASLVAFVSQLRHEVESASAVLAPTAGHGRRIMGWLGCERPVVALPPAASGVPAPATRPLGDQVASADTPLRVGVFGHLHPLKGVGVLLEAQAACRDPARVEVHVWGEAPEEAHLEALTRQAGDRPVVWHGAYRPHDLAGAPVDVVALPTLCAESYSFALDEAADLQVPILASDTGALADRATGRVQLAPRGDPVAWAERLDALADDPARRSAMAASEGPLRLDTDEHRRRLLDVYRQVLDAPRPTPIARDAEQLALREHAFVLREAGLHELLRSEGWEDVVAALRAEVEALRGAGGGA